MPDDKKKTLAFVAFVGVTIVTAFFVLLANVGFFGEEVRMGDFARWGMGAVLAEIVAVTVSAFRWSFRPSVQVRVNLRFPDQKVTQVDLDPEACSYELQAEGKKSEGRVTPVIGPGGWQCTIPADVGSEDVIKLRLKERSGQIWEVGHFYPFWTSQDAIAR